MSDKKCRFLRDKSLVKLNSEYAVKKIETELIGNPDWIQVTHVDFKKWYRKLSNELENLDPSGNVPRVHAWYAQIRGDDLLKAIQNWAAFLVETSQMTELGDLPNCPEELKQKVVLVVGDDSGQGHTR